MKTPTSKPKTRPLKCQFCGQRLRPKRRGRPPKFCSKTCAWTHCMTNKLLGRGKK